VPRGARCVVGNYSVDLKVTEKVEVLIVLLQHDFEHEAVLVLLFGSNVGRVVDLVGLDLVYGVERNSSDGPSQVAN